MDNNFTLLNFKGFLPKLLLVFLLFLSVSLQSQNWETVPNLIGFDESATNTDIFFLDSNTGWISSNNGKIFKTVDGGTTWTEKASGLGQIYSIYFVSATHGWVAGDLYVHYTTDGGDTWTTVQAGASVLSENILSVYFISETHGWASGFNFIYRTIDGGLTWAKVLPAGGVFRDIHFVSETVGFVAGNQNRIMKSIDGGVTWVAQDAGTPYAAHNAIRFIDANTAFVCGQDGVIKKSTDAGATWTSVITQDSNSPDLNDIFFMDANNGWAVGNERTVKRTSDGGVTWADENTLSSPQFASFRAVFFTSLTKGLALAYDDLQTYSVALEPTISSFVPTTATYGDAVVITGEHFTGATEVTFGGVDVSTYAVDSPTQITVTVGAGLSGDVNIDTFGGTATLAGFTYTNQEPNVVAIDDVSYCEPLIAYSIPFTVSDIETLPENLTITGTSSNQALVTNANITSSGNAETKVLTITPETGVSGVVTITVVVTDEANDTAQTTFDLTLGGDITDPVVLTQNISVELDENGTATITVEEIDFGSSDNCSVSAGGVSTIYLSGLAGNKLWSFVPGVDTVPQEITVDWSVVGDYGGAAYFGNYGGLEVNELTGNVYVAGGGGNYNYVMETPLDSNSPMEHFVGAPGEEGTIDFEIDNTTQIVYTATSSGLFSQVIGTATRTELVSGLVLSVTLDIENQVLYFLTPTGLGKINTDGTALVANHLAVINPGVSITMDTSSQRLFWIEQDTNDIYSALTDGSETPFELLDGEGAPGFFTALDYLPATNELYFTISDQDYYDPEDFVFKMLVDGNEPSPELIVTGDFAGVAGIAVGKNVVPRSALELSLDITSFSCEDLGDNTVTLTATDNAGNSGLQTATVTVTDTNDYCTALSTIDVDLARFTIFPSPVDNELNIKNSSNFNINAIKIYDINGRLVLSKTSETLDSDIKINTSNLQTSVYIIKINTDKGVVVKRFVKK